MSKTFSSKDLDSSSSDEQEFEFYPRYASEDFVVFSDKPNNENIPDPKSVINCDLPQTSSTCPQTYQPDSLDSWLPVNEVDSLIESNISRECELNVQERFDAKSNHSRSSRNVTQCTPNFSTKPSYFPDMQDCSGATAAFYDVIEERPRAHSGSYNPVQASNRESGSESFRSLDSNYFKSDNVATFSRAFKKQTESPINFYDNTPEAQVKTKLRTMWNNMKYGNDQLKFNVKFIVKIDYLSNTCIFLPLFYVFAKFSYFARY